ncbi:hypothetical protein ACJ72_08054 [Emergomyces africanus]|uniref:Uncharacterized protein n=1 Tax=Emergomyces africanus TaxID=1955775 RepID=A0A1B7NLS8_9EURO|nr:hypothetical protein ACJ72_08054 [Emergomyces africanus]
MSGKELVNAFTIRVNTCLVLTYLINLFPQPFDHASQINPHGGISNPERTLNLKGNEE